MDNKDNSINIDENDHEDLSYVPPPQKSIEELLATDQVDTIFNFILFKI